ncbi:MAG TPA: dethiobiotin synthase, partial [Acidimicrobiales bacterium]|nr:dethiobiotin synthase [Acidimicrobiales bacterium]
GVSVAARKPTQSFSPEDASPTDAELLGAASGEAPHTVCPPWRWYPLPMAPPMAAARLGRPLPRLAELLEELVWPPPPAEVGLVETAGGLRSPQGVDGDALDLVSALSPNLVVAVADAGLGTIHAVRLVASAMATVDAPYVVVLNRFDGANPLNLDNLRWLTQQDGLDVLPGDADGIRSLSRRAFEEPIPAR